MKFIRNPEAPMFLFLFSLLSWGSTLDGDYKIKEKGLTYRVLLRETEDGVTGVLDSMYAQLPFKGTLTDGVVQGRILGLTDLQFSAQSTEEGQLKFEIIFPETDSIPNLASRRTLFMNPMEDSEEHRLFLDRAAPLLEFNEPQHEAVQKEEKEVK